MSTENHNPINSFSEPNKDTDSALNNKALNENFKAFDGNMALVPFSQCIRVGTNYFLEHANGLIRTNKDCILNDYGRDSLKNVKKYFGFINKPLNINYKKEINGFYNLYRPLAFIPEKGHFLTIEKILRHLFRDKNYKMIMTYLYVLYKYPEHPLPVIALVSELNNTGKTTFLMLLKAIYGENVKVIDPEDISGNFNSSFIDKLLVLIDEKVNSKRGDVEMQKIKKLVTGGTQTRKAKYQDDIDVNFFGKFVMCSNDDQSMLSMENENTRFWIIDAEPIKDSDYEYEIMEKVIKEIPGLLYFLQYMFKPLEKQSRLWLNINDIQTDRVKVFQKNSKNEIAKEVTERLEDYFIEFENKKEVTFSANQFKEAFLNSSVHINSLSRIISTEFKKTTEIKFIENPFNQNPVLKRCRCFVLNRDEIMGSELKNS